MCWGVQALLHSPAAVSSVLMLFLLFINFWFAADGVFMARMVSAVARCFSCSWSAVRRVLVPWCVCDACECLWRVLGVFGVFCIFGSGVGPWFRPYGTYVPYGKDQTALDVFLDLGGHACPRSRHFSLLTPYLDLD